MAEKPFKLVQDRTQIKKSVYIPKLELDKNPTEPIDYQAVDFAETAYF